MLLELQISDFILIERQVIPFSEGFNVLTGETGAGKSMILGALQILSGAPAGKDMIRTGADKALIRATFTSNDEVNRYLQSQGLEADENVILSKEFNVKGKSVSRVNGSVVTTNLLKRITNLLLNIHGQTDNQQLFDPMFQMDQLDRFIGTDALVLRERAATLYETRKRIKKELSQLYKINEDRERTLDFLLFQDKELSEAALSPGEDEKLEERLDLLYASEGILDTLRGAYYWFSESEDTESALSVLSTLSSKFSKLSDLSKELEELSERVAEFRILAEELSRDISRAVHHFDSDPEEIRRIEERLDKINHIKFKYGGTVEQALRKHQEIGDELTKLETLDHVLKEKEEEKLQLEEELFGVSEQLSKLRRSFSSLLSEKIQRELNELNMGESVFAIRVHEEAEIVSTGKDSVDFMIATNSGQPLRTLKKTLSGGELSRVMLAVKRIEGEDVDVSMIFDEIDAGISGRTADVVGKKIRSLSRDSQIICITHLPQIARHAHTHLMIEKISGDHTAKTVVNVLNEESRVREIARLIGVSEITSESLTYAKTMLQECD